MTSKVNDNTVKSSTEDFFGSTSTSTRTSPLQPPSSNNQNDASAATSKRMISIEQAAKFAGVGADTLLRFMESGYFPGGSKEAGIPVDSLEQVFGITIPKPFLKPSPASTSKIASESQTDTDTPDSTSLAFNASDLKTELKEPSAVYDHGTNSEAQSGTVINEDGTDADSSNGVFSSVPRKNLIEMYERLVTKLEDEVRSLRSERDWLKNRVERAEDKSSRDQLLMLSETQTIRTLLMENSRLAETARASGSPLRAILEWFGFVNPQASNPSQITALLSAPMSPSERPESPEIKGEDTEKTNKI